MTATPRPDVLIVSFGFLHGQRPGLLPADLVLDLRRHLADPAHRPQGDMLDKTGLDDEVRDFVLATAGAAPLLEQTAPLVATMAATKFVVVHVGCAGGKHRAAAIATELGDRLRARGLHPAVRHLDVHRPRVIRADELVAC
jgi:RNase adaptor protein for sRNA GlmZ degradation